MNEPVHLSLDISQVMSVHGEINFPSVHALPKPCALGKAPVVRTKHGSMLSPGSYQLKISGFVTSPINTDSRRKIVLVQRLISDLRKFSTRFPTQLSIKATSPWGRKLHKRWSMCHFHFCSGLVFLELSIKQLGARLDNADPTAWWQEVRQQAGSIHFLQPPF